MDKHKATKENFAKTLKFLQEAGGNDSDNEDILNG